MSGASSPSELLKTYGENEVAVIEEQNQDELEDALLEEKSVIILKDSKLATRTILWLYAGRAFDGMSMATALGAIICSLEPATGLLQYSKPLAVCSILTSVGYYVLWSNSTLIRYSISQGPDVISTIKGRNPPSTILVRKDQCKRRWIYGFFAAVATIMAFWNDIPVNGLKETFEKIKSGTKEVIEETTKEVN